MTSVANAITQLADGNASGKIFTFDELRGIAGSVSAASSSPNGVLYSGPLNNKTQAFEAAASIADSMGWGVLDRTDRAALLNSPEFLTATRNAVQNYTGLTGGALDEAVDRTLGAAGENGAVDFGRSFFSQGSVEFTQSLTGQILTLTPNARADGVYAVDELKTALSDPNGGPINGIARPELITKAQTLGYDAAREQVNTAAASIIGTNGIAENKLYSDGSSTAIRRFELTTEGASRLGVDPSGFRPYLDAQATGGHGSLASTYQTGGELEGLSGGGTPNRTAAELDGATLIELNTFVAGRLKTLDTAGYVYDTVKSSAKAVEQLQNGDAAGSNATLKEFASRLYYGLQGAEAGILLGVGAFSETGPGAVVAGLVGGTIGGLAGAVYGPEAVDAIWNMSRQVIDYMTGQSGPGVAITVHPDPALQQQIEDLRQQLLSSGVPADQANEFINLAQGDWAHRSAADQNLTLSDFAHRMVNDVQDNQQAVPSVGGGPTITVEPTAPDQNGNSGKDAQVFDAFGNARAEVISNPDGSSSAVAYNASGRVVEGASITPDGTTSEAIKNQPGGAQQYTGFETNAAGSAVADLQQFGADGTEQYEQVTTISAVGDVSAAISGSGDVADLNNASITLASGTSATIDGHGDSINVGAGASLTLTGNNNALILTASSAVNLSGTGESVSGSGAAVTLGANSSAAFTGPGNTIFASQGDVITEDNAIINVAQGASVTILGSGDTIVAAGNNIINVTGGGDTINLSGANNYVGLFGNANADTVNGDVATDQVVLVANTSAVVNGSGGSIVLYGSGETLTASNETIHTIDNATGETIIGSGDAIYTGSNFAGSVVGGGDIVNFSGSNNYVGLYGNANADTVNGDVATDNVVLVANTAAVVNGSGGSIVLYGSNETLTASNQTIHTVDNASGETIIGSGDTIFTGSGFAGSVVGGGDIINFSGGNNYAGLYGNANADIVNGDVATDNVVLVANTTAVVNGSGGSIVLYGSGETLTASNQIIHAIDNASGETIIGSGDAITTGTGFSGSVFGGGDTVNFSGANNYVGLYGNANADIVNGVVATDSVYLINNTTAVVNGSGGSIVLYGSGDTLTASNEIIHTIDNATGETIAGSGDTITTGTGFSGNVIGGGDTVNFGGANNYVGLYGNANADTVNGVVATDNVVLVANTTAAVNGSGGAIALYGSGETLTASNQTINTIDNATGETIIGSGDTIFTGSGFAGSVVGGGDVVNLGGTGETLTASNATIHMIDHATGETIIGSGDAIYTGTGFSGNVVGGGNFVNLGGTGETLTASNATIHMIDNATGETIIGSGDTIFTGTGFAGNVVGGGDIVNFSGANNYVGLYGNGNADTVNGVVATDNIVLVQSTAAAVTGSGGSIVLYGSGETLTASNQTIHTIDNATGETIIGSGDVIYPGSGFEGSVHGGGDTVHLGGTGNTVALYGNNSQADIVTNDIPGDNVALVGSMKAEVYGNSGHINLNASNETLTSNNESISGGDNLTGEIINGVNNTINAGNGFSATIAGANDTVIADHSHILLVSGDSNDQVHGDHDIIVAQPEVTDYIYGNADTYNGQSGNFDGDPVNGGGDDGSDFWENWWPDDPIVLNLDGGAVQTQALQSSTAYFDMQNNGARVHTGWVTAGEGLLVYDPDGSNRVSGDRDLVAGFDALKTLAKEVDGAGSDTLSASNAVWAKLKVWVDATGTGDFRSDQLYTLGQLGITSINLNAANVQESSNGNTIVADSSFTRSDGSSGDIAGVALAFASGPANPAASANVNPAAQLQQLISAMAGLAAPGAGVLPMIAEHQNSLPITLAAGQH
jgi:hypothetical protein